MNQIETGCANVRELLPDYAAGRLDESVAAGIEGHLAACDECREELDLVEMLFATRVAPPAGLDDRIVSALGRRKTVAHRPWWGLSAAAVAAVALGIGVSSDPTVTIDPLQVEPIATSSSSAGA